MTVNYFELSSRPVKGIPVELSTETIIIPALTMYHYVELEADKKIKKVMQYYINQEQAKAKSLLEFSEINSKIVQVGSTGLTKDETEKLQSCLENINSPIMFDKEIIDTFLELALMSINRNYPNMTKKVLMEEIDFNAVQEITSLLQSQEKTLKKSPTPIQTEIQESVNQVKTQKKLKK